MGIDLRTEFLGLSLRNPLVASSSPLTGDLDGLRALEDAGAAAVVLPALFEAEARHGGPDRYAERVRRAKQALDIPVLASLHGATPGGWAEHAKEIEQAGADALELTLGGVAADPGATAAELETALCELVRRVRATVQIPLSVKIGPYFTALAHTARDLVAAGADGLVLFDRFSQPDLDLDTLEVSAQLALSRSEDLRLPLRWIAILHGQVDASLAASSGVHVADDALKAFLAGADVVMMASALLARGPRQLSRVERGILEWMDEHGAATLRELVGRRSRSALSDPAPYERAGPPESLRPFSRA